MGWGFMELAWEWPSAQHYGNPPRSHTEVLLSGSDAGNFRELFKGTLQGLAMVLLRLSGNLTSPHRCIIFFSFFFFLVNCLWQMQDFCLFSWTFFRASYKLPWPVWGGINFLRWLLMEVLQVLTGSSKWDTGKMNWNPPFSCMWYWPFTHIHIKSSQWWCTKTVPLLGFSGALFSTAWKPAFETPWASGIRLLYFYGIITLSLPHKKWDVRM